MGLAGGGRFIEVTKKITPTGPELYLRTCAKGWSYEEMVEAYVGKGRVPESDDPWWHSHPALGLRHMHAHEAPHAHEPEVCWGKAFLIPDGLCGDGTYQWS